MIIVMLWYTVQYISS